MTTHLRTELVLQALQTPALRAGASVAIRQRRPRTSSTIPTMVTSHTSLAFGRRCREAGIRPPMGSVGDCFDNAMCESFFATLECELLDRTSFRSRLKRAYRFSVYRRLVQSASSSLGHRLSLTQPVRSPTCSYPTSATFMCPLKRGNSPEYAMRSTSNNLRHSIGIRSTF